MEDDTDYGKDMTLEELEEKNCERCI